MVLIRPATRAELEEPVGFAMNDPVGFVDADSLREEVAAGRLRPEWSWFAVDGSRIVARALWWGREDSERPLALDFLHVLADVPDRAALAAELMSRAHTEFHAKPEYVLVVPTAGQDADPAVADAVSWRREAAQAAGLTEMIERLRFEWTPAAGVPAPSERLMFRPASDDEFLAVFQRVAVGSLDVATQRGIAATDIVSQARDDLEFYRLPWRTIVVAAGGDHGRDAGRLRDPVRDALPSQRRIPRSSARAARVPLRGRHPLRDHPRSRSRWRQSHHRDHGRTQHAHGRRVQAGELPGDRGEDGVRGPGGLSRASTGGSSPNRAGAGLSVAAGSSRRRIHSTCTGMGIRESSHAQLHHCLIGCRRRTVHVRIFDRQHGVLHVSPSPPPAGIVSPSFHVKQDR